MKDHEVEGERELIHLLGKNERDLTPISGHDLSRCKIRHVL